MFVDFTCFIKNLRKSMFRSFSSLKSNSSRNSTQHTLNESSGGLDLGRFGPIEPSGAPFCLSTVIMEINESLRNRMANEQQLMQMNAYYLTLTQIIKHARKYSTIIEFGPGYGQYRGGFVNVRPPKAPNIIMIMIIKIIYLFNFKQIIKYTNI